MEIIDLYDIDKYPTGKTGTHPDENTYRLVVHLCLFSGDKMLIQKRSDACHKWGGLWDVTVSGIAKAGEKGRDAAMRECTEELGLEIDLKNARPALTVSFGCGFDEVFIAECRTDISSLTLQEEEVEDVKYASLDEILALCQKGEFTPFYPEYLKLLFKIRHSGDVME